MITRGQRRLSWLAASMALLAGCWSLEYQVALKPQRSTVLTVGDTVQLTAEFYAEGPGFPLGPGHETVYTSQDRPTRFRWMSSDTLVVRVDANGLAVAVAPGRSTLTAQASGIVSRGVLFSVQ